MLSVKNERPRSPIEVMLVKQETLIDIEMNQDPELEPLCDLIKEEKDDSDIIQEIKHEDDERGREYLLEPEIIIKMIYKCRSCGDCFDDRPSFDIHVNEAHDLHRKSEIPEITKEQNSEPCQTTGCDNQDNLRRKTEEVSRNTRRNPEINKNLLHNRRKSQEKLSKAPKEYYCEPCKKTFSSSSTLRQHHKGVHLNIKQKKPEIYRCKFCKEELPNEYQKAKHQAQVHLDGERPLRSCWVCGAKIQLFADFKKHVESHESENLKICLSCGFTSSTREAMTEHLEKHKNLRYIEKELRRLTCDLCGHKVYTRGQLKVHMRNHMKEADFYVCDICGQSYKFFSSFQYHKKMHEGRKDYVCTECGRKFMQREVLNVHMRTHTQEKPFKCSVCEKSFASKPVLKTHLQVHASTRRIISCEECNLTFVYPKHLKAHEERFHPNRRPFQCHLCSKRFMHEYLRKIHMKQKHKSENSSFCDMEICE